MADQDRWRDDRWRYEQRGWRGGGGRRFEDDDDDRHRAESWGDRDDWRRREQGRYGGGHVDDFGREAYGPGYVGNEGRGYGYGPDYGRGPAEYDRQGYGRRDQGRGGHAGSGERGVWDRMTDEVASWFGDEDAQQRREQDHRGRGPRGYTRSDERIREDVSDRLADDWRVDASDIEVGVSQGEVTLSGTVDSREARRRAEDLAEAVSGVRYVQNNLRVRDRRSMSRLDEQTHAPGSATGSTGTTTTGSGTGTNAPASRG